MKVYPVLCALMLGVKEEASMKKMQPLCSSTYSSLDGGEFHNPTHYVCRGLCGMQAPAIHQHTEFSLGAVMAEPESHSSS